MVSGPARSPLLFSALELLVDAVRGGVFAYGSRFRFHIGSASAQLHAPPGMGLPISHHRNLRSRSALHGQRT